MRLVILESPYAGNIEQNILYAKKCVLDCLLRGEAPIASHLLFTQEGILEDHNKEQRELGIKAGLSWQKVADAVVVYTDRGISPGMAWGITSAHQIGLTVEYRTLENTL